MHTSAPRQTLVGVQYLRGIAAIMVVAHHARHYFSQADSWTDFGSRGVDVFFVISGLIMAYSTRGVAAGSIDRATIADFLTKRFIRVVPLYWIALLWTSKKVILDPEIGPTIGLDLLFIPHFHAVYTTGVYPYLVPGWTINYEVTFYVLFAGAMLFGSRRYVVMACLLIALVCMSFLKWTSAAAIFYTSSVLLEFLLGLLVYFALARWRVRCSNGLLVAVFMASTALLAIETSDQFRGFTDGPFAALMVWCCAQIDTAKLSSRALLLLGDASYSIYLFHLAAFQVPDRLLRGLGFTQPDAWTVFIVIGAHVMSAIFAGVCIHLWIEKPMLEALRRRWMSN
jgi:exopolysaccharide production protein ExoZ